jgi:hypothetical protein
MMCNARTLEERCEFLILSTRVRLNGKNLIEETLYKLLEIMKPLKDIEFIF